MAITVSKAPKVRIRQLGGQCVAIDVSSLAYERRASAIRQSIYRLIKLNPAKQVINTLPVVIDGSISEVFVWFGTKNPSANASGATATAFTDSYGYGAWIHDYLQTREWPDVDSEAKLSRRVLQRSLTLGQRFLIRNQLPEGNFVYEYDFDSGTTNPDDNAVRQAGALWSLSLILQHEADAKLQAALERGLAFFERHSIPGANGSSLIAYPGEKVCPTGGVALVSLAIIDYLRAYEAGIVNLEPERVEQLKARLNQYLKHLLIVKLPDGHFARALRLNSGKLDERRSPYADGEVLLCLIKAARYRGRMDLLPLIQSSALRLLQSYTTDVWDEDPDSDLTKGFYQWSSMALREYYDAGWPGADTFGDYVLAVAWWMIHTHKTLSRTRNTGYAYEGLIQALLVARARNETRIEQHLLDIIDTGMQKLTSWQVGGPLQSANKFLTKVEKVPKAAVGGVMNKKNDSLLRIDVTQHQMHAVVLALKHIY